MSCPDLLGSWQRLLGDLQNDEELPASFGEFVATVAIGSPTPSTFERLIDERLAQLLIESGIGAGGELNSVGERIQDYINRATLLRLRLGAE